VFYERTAHPLALKLRAYSQRCEDGCGNTAGSTCKNRFGEQYMPDWLVRQEGKQGQAWLSCGVLEQVDYQRRFILARKGRAFDAQHDIEIRHACFNDSHDA
jgi:hypothetical protein